MKLNKHVITWVAGIVLAVAAFLSLVTGPQMGQIRTVMAQIDSEQQSHEVADETSQRIKALEQEVEKLQERTATFDDQIPVGETLGSFLQDLGRFAEQRHVRLEEIQPGTAVPSKKVIALPITFKVHGPFTQVFELIKDVEQMDRLTLIERLETTTDEMVPGTVTAQLRLRVYFRAS